MEVLSRHFKSASRAALLDKELRAALDRAEGGFVQKRLDSIDELKNFESFRDYGEKVKDHTLDHLDHYLTLFEDNVKKNGGHVHWAVNGEEANKIIVEICRKAGAKKILKGKSMVSEEMAANASLEKQGFQVMETDLGEYIIQLAGETPSHIIAPAVHKSREKVADLFYDHHSKLGCGARATAPEDIVNQARQILRAHFCSSDVGITGGNFLIAETGAVVVVTNEGNGDLAASLPKVHIVTASIEKVIPDLKSLGGFLRILGRSATGQSMSVYTTLFNGPKRKEDLDGPEQFHVILLDNGRSSILKGSFKKILRCIRCGACLNHCPVYTRIGGHAYGWVYPGPMGSVLTPILVGRTNAADLPNACTLNGRCESVCPVKIPLPELLRNHRMELNRINGDTFKSRFLLSVWASLAKRPGIYRFVTALIIGNLYLLAKLRPGASHGYFTSLPLMSAWTDSRHFPVPGRSTFQRLWKKQRGGR